MSKQLVPAYPVTQSPGGTITRGEEAIIYEPTPSGSGLRIVMESTSRELTISRWLEEELVEDSASEEEEEGSGSEEQTAPIGSPQVSDTEQESDEQVWKPPTTPTTPEVSSPSCGSRPMRARRSLLLDDEKITKFLADSGSEDESDGDDEEEAPQAFDLREARRMMRLIRDEEVRYEEECEEREQDDECEKREQNDEECIIMNEEVMLGNRMGEELMNEEVMLGNRMGEELEPPTVAQAREYENVVMNEERVIGDDSVVSHEQPLLGQEYEGLDVFSWSENYSSFSGTEETYLRTPGPMVESYDPAQIFMKVWDEKIMGEIVSETNKYAWQIIAPLSERVNGLPDYLEWTDTTIPEMYRYFAILIFMSMCNRGRVKDYWTTGYLEMAAFRNMMSRNRFLAITRFLHFVDNESYDLSLSSYEKKNFKIIPIIKHCNGKFGELYTPSKHLSLDESLLLWKGRLSWVQCIRTKAARFGIKSFELCEAVSGYQLRSLLYAGKNSSMSAKSIHGFENCTAKVVLELMDGYLDVGHTLIMDRHMDGQYTLRVPILN